MKLKLLALVLVVFVIVGSFFVYRNKNSDTSPYQPVIVPENEIPPETVTFYSASDEHAEVTFTGVDATIVYEPLGSVTLREVDSGSGGLYTNDTETLTLWDRGDKITLWDGDKVLFEGYGETVVEETSVLDGVTWVWERTEKSDMVRITPTTQDAFTLVFDGEQVRGGTDCNSFSGVVSRDEEVLVFGTLASTMMYCEGSQESVFTESLAQVDRYRITDSGTLSLFLKDEAGAMYFRSAE